MLEPLRGNGGHTGCVDKADGASEKEENRGRINERFENTNRYLFQSFCVLENLKSSYLVTLYCNSHTYVTFMTPTGCGGSNLGIIND
jgi:hypothetical protein